MRAFRWVSLASVTIGLLLLGFAVYTIVAPSAIDKSNGETANNLIEQWGIHPAPETPYHAKKLAPTLPSGDEQTSNYTAGNPFAVVRIPSLNIVSPIAEGTDAATLHKGVGHLVGTSGPGQVGNFTTAGHVCCRGSGQPYKKTYQLDAGDKIIVETSAAVYTYGVVFLPCHDSNLGPNGHVYVTPDRIDVTNPVPCESDTQKSTRKLMTLITCYPDRSIVDLSNRPAPYRLIVWAELESVLSRK